MLRNLMISASALALSLAMGGIASAQQAGPVVGPPSAAPSETTTIGLNGNTVASNNDNSNQGNKTSTQTSTKTSTSSMSVADSGNNSGNRSSIDTTTVSKSSDNSNQGNVTVADSGNNSGNRSSTSTHTTLTDNSNQGNDNSNNSDQGNKSVSNSGNRSSTESSVKTISTDNSNQGNLTLTFSGPLSAQIMSATVTGVSVNLGGNTERPGVLTTGDVSSGNGSGYFAGIQTASLNTGVGSANQASTSLAAVGNITFGK